MTSSAIFVTSSGFVSAVSICAFAGSVFAILFEAGRRKSFIEESL